MAGIYLHIPFCKQTCHYCDFHFAVSLKNKPDMVQGLIKELRLRKDYLQPDTRIETVYLGGGTPSLLSEKELGDIFEVIYKNFEVAENAEITLEANPDDLSKERLKQLKSTPVNRLSLGIQSFFEEDLQWMNRAHTVKDAEAVLINAQMAGFDNLSADLIYGFPLLTDKKWEVNMDKMLCSGIRHFSAYSMTVEKGTPLDSFIRKGQQKPMNEEQSARQFLMLQDKIEATNWEQYEISNYARDEHYSLHNTNYWRGKSYLGIGPSAHSFNGLSRQWNTKVNSRYLKGIQTGEPIFEKEILSPKDKVNEYMLTGLRTKWGIAQKFFNDNLSGNLFQNFKIKCDLFIKQGWLAYTNGFFFLTRQGKLFADYIAAELFV